MKRTRQLVTLLLALCMLLQVLPVTAHAAETAAAAAETVEIGSSITSTPDIPRAAKEIPGVSQTEVKLNDTVGSGSWKFLLAVPDYTTSGMPAPGAADQDFDFDKWSSLSWENIKVPGEPTMQGFDIKANNEYYYQTTITVPQDFAGQRVLLRFDGVYCNARVWIGSQHVKTHVGGFTTWDVDLTDLVKPGESAVLTLGIASIYAKTVGIWNPDGVSVNNPANADEYAHHNIGGILRDVSLVAMPKTGIARTYINTDFDENFVNATLELTSQLTMADASAKLTAEVLDGETVVASGSIDFEKKDGQTLSDAKKIGIPVTAPKQWDAEHPNLYTLRTTLTVGGETKQVNEEKFGFREISYAAKDGTAANKIFVNGKEVKLRGTCRHDVSEDLGRSMTEEECWAEIRAYKKANINFIRTSHYPVSEYTLDACDALGMYVEQETAVCFQGPWGDVVSKYQDYLPQFAEMIERDRNRASILMWSLGNESYAGKIQTQSGGDAVGDEGRYVKKVDPSRPIIFSYPNQGETIGLDIYSIHYASVTGSLGSSTMPVLHDEYAHVPCYDLDELQRDTNVRNAWGESLKIAWENMFTTDGALGGAIWGGIDDVFYVPDGISQFWQSHSTGQTTGYGEWGAVLDAYLREKPEAFLTKKAYSPVRVDEDNVAFQNGTLLIPVKNWFDHTNFNELSLRYTIDGEATTVPVRESIAPHASGTLHIVMGAQSLPSVMLEFLDASGMVIDTFDVKLGESSYSFAPIGDTAPEVQETEQALTLSGESFTITFSKQTGLITHAAYQGETLLTGGPYLHTTGGADMGAWTLANMQRSSDGKQERITLNGSYESGVAVRFEICVSGNGVIDTTYTVTSGSAQGLSELGVRYDIPGEVYSVDWLREGLYSYYPEDAIGRNSGTALRVRENAESEPDQYGVTPSWPWKDDMKNYFVYATKDPNNGIQTNDFKAMRENIRYYNVNFSAQENAPHISVESAEAQDAARVQLTCNGGYIDDTDERVRYTGSWSPYNVSSDYNGTEHYSTVAGDACEVTFNGTGIRFIGAKQKNTGTVDVYIDGVKRQTVDTYSNLGSNLKQTTIYDIDNLEKGEHTLRLVTGSDSYHCIVVDAFEVYGSAESSKLSSSLIVNQFWSYPSMNWGNFTRGEKTISAGTSGSVRIRLTNTETYTEQKIESLSGLDISQIGNTLRAEYTVQNATAETEPAEVAWYRVKIGDPADKAEQVGTGASYTMRELVGSSYYCTVSLRRADGNVIHKTSETVTPNENLVGYYDVVTDDPMFTFSGTAGVDYTMDKDQPWTQTAYGKTVVYLLDRPDDGSVSFTFTGKTFRWVGAKEMNMGIATVQMDGGEAEKVDLYGSATTGEQISEILYEKTFETAGTHTVTITRTKEKNPDASQANISLDLFLVLQEAPAEDQAVKAVEKLIDDIGEVTKDSGEAIKAARDAYDALNEEQKSEVSNASKLTEAEKAYAALLDDEAAVKAVEDLIDAIGPVTLNSKPAIDAARNAYNALSPERQAKVSNYPTLTAAEAAYADLLKPVTPVKPSNPAQKPFNPDAGENVKKLPFVDVPSSSWYYESVRKAWSNGLIDGVTATEFKPDNQLTVAQAIKLAAALHQMQKTGSVTLTSGSPNWYDSYVAYAVNNGVIEKDYLNYTKAQMNAPATRGEFVHIFSGALLDAAAINTVADNKIPDVKTTDKYGAEIYTFYRAGITVGSDAAGTFHPASSIKRSEVAAILQRMYDTAARKGITLN